MDIIIVKILALCCAFIDTGTEEIQEFEDYEIKFQWSSINFTWETAEAYNNAITSQKYIPQNVAISSTKFYKNRLYLAMPRYCPGTPVTLGYVSTEEDTPQINPLVTPFPDWDTNDFADPDCSKLESVYGMEVDANGILWVLDGYRLNQDALCPPKLVLYDLNNDSKVIHTFIFPSEIALRRGGLLNNIVIDDTDGGYAYITDTSIIDPGLIVFSRTLNSAWKLRDSSMLPNAKKFNSVKGIGAIGLSPKSTSESRKVFYSPFSGLNLYSIETNILKDKNLFFKAGWRLNITDLGEKLAQTDAITIDNKGNLYYGMAVELFGIARWNIYEPFTSVKIVDQNDLMLSPGSFTFDDEGYIYALPVPVSVINNYYSLHCQSSIDENETKFRSVKHFAGAQSYLYS